MRTGNSSHVCAEPEERNNDQIIRIDINDDKVDYNDEKKVIMMLKHHYANSIILGDIDIYINLKKSSLGLY